MRTPLEKYFAQRIKNLFNHLHDFELQGDEVSLHDLRVEMKKLRAVIKFLRQVYPGQKLKRPAHALRAIFQQAGEIREMQILEGWLQKNNFVIIEQAYYPPEKLHALIRDFQRITEKLKEDFNGIIDTVSKFVESTNEILAEQYFTNLNAQLESLCNKDLPKTDWHELRKLIKQRIYAYNWINHESENDDPHFSFYNKLQETIGLWHDLELIKESFSQKQVYLSQDIEVQKDFNLAWDKLESSIRQKERQIEEMLSKQIVQD